MDELIPDFAKTDRKSGFFGPWKEGLLDGRRVAFILGSNGPRGIVAGEFDPNQEQLTDIYLDRLKIGEPLPAESSARRLDPYLGPEFADISSRYLLNATGRAAYPELKVPEIRHGLLALSDCVREVGFLESGGIELHLAETGLTRSALESDAKILVSMLKALDRDRPALKQDLAQAKRPFSLLPILKFLLAVVVGFFLLSAWLPERYGLPRFQNANRSAPQRSSIRRAPARRARAVSNAAAKDAPALPIPPAVDATAFAQTPSKLQKPASGAILVTVSLRKGGFAPTPSTSGSYSCLHPLTASPPPGLVREPAYLGQQRRYLTLSLGTVHKTPFIFALDFIKGFQPVLYVDKNHNGDLSDDGEPLTNEGSGNFATTVRIPFKQLIKEADFPGDYEMWLFINDQCWSMGCWTHYSRTDLKGRVKIGGRTYAAKIGEKFENDANYTNDGISIDLNQDGRFDKRTETVYPGGSLKVGGKDYAFRVIW